MTTLNQPVVPRGGVLFCEVDGVAIDVAPEHLRGEGMFVPTDTPLKLDREIELGLRSQVGEVALQALVVQVVSADEAAVQRRSPGYGVLFLDLQDDQRAWIALTRNAFERAQPKDSPAPKPPAEPEVTPTPNAGAIERARSSRKKGSVMLRANTLAQLQTELEEIKTRSPWELLNVDPIKGVDVAHQAFLAISKRRHPHMYARFDSEEITRVSTELFIAYKRAYATIRAAARRSEREIAVTQPLSPLAFAGNPEAPSSRSSRPAAPRGRASTAPRGASLPPRRTSIPPGGDPAGRRLADAELALSSALKHLAATRLEQAERELAKAAALAPDRIDVATWLHVCRARTHKSAGRTEAALEHYRKALALDPANREALENLPRAESRRGGLVSKWLGRNEE